MKGARFKFVSHGDVLDHGKLMRADSCSARLKDAMSHVSCSLVEQFQGGRVNNTYSMVLYYTPMMFNATHDSRKGRRTAQGVFADAKHFFNVWMVVNGNVS